MLVLGRGIFWAQDTAELFERRGSYIEVQTPKMPSQQQDFRLVDPELKLLFAPVGASHNMYIYIYIYIQLYWDYLHKPEGSRA